MEPLLVDGMLIAFDCWCENNCFLSHKNSNSHIVTTNLKKVLEIYFFLNKAYCTKPKSYFALESPLKQYSKSNPCHPSQSLGVFIKNQPLSHKILQTMLFLCKHKKQGQLH